MFVQNVVFKNDIFLETSYTKAKKKKKNQLCWFDYLIYKKPRRNEPKYLFENSIYFALVCFLYI